MNYAAIKKCDIADGPGVRVSLFCSGCTHHCPGCFQPETWDFGYGEPFTGQVIDRILGALEPYYIAGLTLLGGEPFEPDNVAALLPLVMLVRNRLPGKTVWAYSGYTLEELRARPGMDGRRTRFLLSLIDVLVDGPFVMARKNICLRFRGSENQRLIDLRRTEASGKIILWT